MNAVQMALILPQLQEPLGVTPLKGHILTTVAIWLRDLPLKVVAANLPLTHPEAHTHLWKEAEKPPTQPMDNNPWTTRVPSVWSAT